MYQKRVFLHILAQFSDIGIPERGSEVSGPFTVFSAPGVFEATHSRFLAFLCRKDDGREGNSSVELASRERRVVSPGSVRPTNAPDKPKRTSDIPKRFEEQAGAADSGQVTAPHLSRHRLSGSAKEEDP